MKTRYQPVDSGYQIVGSHEMFNRTLYGGHGHDSSPERYFTFAGDLPIAMGAVTDWRQGEDCAYATCGVFMAGVALTPGVSLPMFYYRGEKGGDPRSPSSAVRRESGGDPTSGTAGRSLRRR